MRLIEELIILIEKADAVHLKSVSDRLKISVEEVDKLSSEFDPTPNKKYQAWILRQMVQRFIILPEDGNRLRQVLVDFINISRKPDSNLQKDINRYSRIHDLEDQIDKYKEEHKVIEVKTKSSLLHYSKKEIEEFVEMGGEIIIENREWMVLKNQKSYELEMKLAQNTRWCTDEKKYAKDYLKKGPYYEIFKREGSFYVLMYSIYSKRRDEIVLIDIKDRELGLDEIPESLVKLILKEKQDLILLVYPEAILLFGDSSEEVQLAAVKSNGYAIRYILARGITPSEEVQLAAVKKDIGAIQFILDKEITPSEEVQLAVVSKNGYAIRYILNKEITPSERVQLAAVKQNGDAIIYILDKGIKPTEKVQLAAVSNDGYLIKYILNKGITPSEKVQLAAVKQNVGAIQHIKDPSEEVQLAAVSKYGYALQYILEKGITPSERVKELARKKGYRI